MRIDRQHPQESSRIRLHSGQTIQGKVVVDNGATFLMHRGGRFPVRMEGPVPDGLSRFLILQTRGEILLRHLPQAGSSTGAQPTGRSSLLSKLVSVLGIPAGRTGGQAFETGGMSLLGQIFQLVFPPEDAARALRLLKVYLDAGASRKKGVNRDGNPADIDKEVLCGFLEELGLQVTGSALPVTHGQSEDGQDPGFEEQPREREFAFLLLPVQTQDGGTELIPLLCIGTPGSRQRAWLFSECSVSEIGPVRLMLFQSHGQLRGEILCEPGAGSRLRDGVVDERFFVREQRYSGSIAEWPLMAILESEKGFFDGQV